MNAPSALLRGRRRVAPVALALGVLAIAAVAALTLGGSEGGGGGRATAGGGSTAEVTRQTLVARETVDGTLGYSGGRTVINRLGSSGGGGGDTPTGDDSTSASDDGSSVDAIPAALFTPDEEPDAQDPEEELPEEDQPEEPEEQEEPEQEEPEQEQPEQEEPEQEQPEQEEPEQERPESDAPQTAEPSQSDPPSSGDDSSGGYSGSGTVTALAKLGSVVERGEALYRLDGDPIVLMYGSTPAYRALKSGVADGRDILQLEQNLAALGFDPGTVDETFTSQTAVAVSDWQESVGLEETGSIELGRVVFQPGPRRVGEHKTSVGSVLGAGSEVMQTSSTRRVVTIELDATLQTLAHKGDGVEVTLPDGSIVRGRISKVGRVAREISSGQDDPNAEQQLVIDVTVKLRSSKGLGQLDEAPVGVGLAQESRERVLAVPLNALLARRGGGYGVELADSHRIVPVETGLFASGYVEVSGPAIHEGTRVMVPSE